MGTRKLVCWQDPPACCLVGNDLGDICAELLLRGAVDPHHLERSPGAAGTEARDDPIVLIAEAYDLVFRPESRRWRRRWRDRLAQQSGQRRFDILQRSPRLGVVHHSLGQRVQDSCAGFVFPLREQRPQTSAQRIHVGSMIRGPTALGANFGSNRVVPSVHRGIGGSHGNVRRDSSVLEAGQDRRVVVLDEKRPPREVSMHHGLFVFTGLVQFPERTNGATREVQTRRRIPFVIGCAFLDAGRSGIGQREEGDLTLISGCILVGIEDTWRPAMQLQPKQRLEFASRPRLRLWIVARGQIIEVQNHPILPCGMGPPVNPVEPLVGRRLELQAGVAGQPLQRAVHCDLAIWRQSVGEHPDLLRRQRARRIETNRVPPGLERVERNAPNDPALEPTDLGGCLGDQERAVHPPEARSLLA